LFGLRIAFLKGSNCYQETIKALETNFNCEVLTIESLYNELPINGKR